MFLDHAAFRLRLLQMRADVLVRRGDGHRLESIIDGVGDRRYGGTAEGANAVLLKFRTSYGYSRFGKMPCSAM